MTTEQLIERVQLGDASITGSTLTDLGERYLIVTDHERCATEHILVPSCIIEADELYAAVGHIPSRW